MSEILKIKDLNKGAILKQGDTTTLKYYLYDADEENIESIIGTTAEVVFIKDNQVYYRTNGTVNDLFICEFEIEEVLPVGKYHIEFIVLGKIFPSNADPYFTITRSSLGNDINIIKVNGFEELVIRTVSEVEERLEPFVDELETNEQTRKTNESSRVADEDLRKANEVQRNEKQIRLKNLFENGDFSKGTTGVLGPSFDFSVENGELVATIKSLSSVGSVQFATTENHVPPNRYFVSFEMQVKHADSYSSVTVGGYSSIGINPQLKSNDFAKVSLVQDPPSNLGAKMIRVDHKTDGTVFTYKIGDKLRFRKLIVINLTQTFGAGNEPTKEQMDELLDITGYISGERIVSPQEMFKLIGARAKKKQEDWVTPTLLNGTINYPEVKNRPLRYRLNEFGELQIMGTISPVPNGTHIFTLPERYRGSDVNFTRPLVATSGTNKAVVLEINHGGGEVKVFGQSTAYIDINITISS